ARPPEPAKTPLDPIRVRFASCAGARAWHESPSAWPRRSASCRGARPFVVSLASDLRALDRENEGSPRTASRSTGSGRAADGITVRVARLGAAANGCYGSSVAMVMAWHRLSTLPRSRAVPCKPTRYVMRRKTILATSMFVVSACGMAENDSNTIAMALAGPSPRETAAQAGTSYKKLQERAAAEAAKARADELEAITKVSGPL